MRVYSCMKCPAKYLFVCGNCDGIQFREESISMAPSSRKDLTLRIFHRNENVLESNSCTQPNFPSEQQQVLDFTDIECRRSKDSDVSNVRSQPLEDKQPLDHVSKNETAFKRLSSEIVNNNRDPNQTSRPTVIVSPRNEDAKSSNFRSQNIISKEGQQCDLFIKNRTSTNGASPVIPITCNESQTSSAQDNEKILHTNFNYVADTTCPPREIPQRLKNVYGQPPITEHSKESSIEMMLGKQTTAESSGTESQDVQIDISGSSRCRSRSLPSFPENFNLNHDARHPQKKATKCSPDQCSKRGSQPTQNFCLQQRAHSSKKPKMQWAEKYSTAHAHLAECSASEATNQIFECKKCTRKFKNEKRYTVHMEAHEKGDLYKCNQCPWKFRLVSRLKMHAVVHAKEKPFKCNHCKYAFGNKHNLVKHIKRHHKSLLSIKEMECNKCLVQFRRESKRSADDPKAFKCKMCSAGFHCEHKLNHHYDSAHKGEKHYKCDVIDCNYASKSRFHLKAHRNVHKK